MKTLALTFLSISSAFAGIIEPKVIWDKTEIVTCFYDHESQLTDTTFESVDLARSNYKFVPRELSRREKAKVKETVLANFSEERTGIHFVGFKDCSQTPQYDLVVMEAKGKIPLLTRPSFNGRAVIGEEGHISVNSHGERGFFYKTGKISNVALYSQNRGTVVHEFGHVAGLRHEHVNEASRRDPNCQSFAVTIDFDNLEKPHVTTEFVTAYDPQSIMNYCHLQPNRSALNRNKGLLLSQKDIQTLRAFYK